MEEIIHKKLNLLVHLAKVDGKFDRSERAVLMEMLNAHGVTKLDEPDQEIDLNDFKSIPSKSDILYWAIRLIKADGILHPDELAFCKALAVKLNYSTDIIDHFSISELGTTVEFKKLARQFASSSI